MTSWIDKRDGDVAGAVGGWESFVVMSEASRMYQSVTFGDLCDGTIVSKKVTSTSLLQHKDLIKQLKNTNWLIQTLYELR